MTGWKHGLIFNFQATWQSDSRSIAGTSEHAGSTRRAAAAVVSSICSSRLVLFVCFFSPFLLCFETLLCDCETGSRAAAVVDFLPRSVVCDNSTNLFALVCTVIYRSTDKVGEKQNIHVLSTHTVSPFAEFRSVRSSRSPPGVSVLAEDIRGPSARPSVGQAGERAVESERARARARTQTHTHSVQCVFAKSRESRGAASVAADEFQRRSRMWERILGGRPGGACEAAAQGLEENPMGTGSPRSRRRLCHAKIPGWI